MEQVQNVYINIEIIPLNPTVAWPHSVDGVVQVDNKYTYIYITTLYTVKWRRGTVVNYSSSFIVVK